MKALASLYVYSGRDVPSCTRKQGLQLMPLSASSQISLSEASMDRVVTISVNHEHEAVMVKEPGPPPAGGADGDGIREASQAREKLPKYHRKYPAYP